MMSSLRYSLLAVAIIALACTFRVRQHVYDTLESVWPEGTRLATLYLPSIPSFASLALIGRLESLSRDTPSSYALCTTPYRGILSSMFSTLGSESLIYTSDPSNPEIECFITESGLISATGSKGSIKPFVYLREFCTNL
jgi:hypothetical protein